MTKQVSKQNIAIAIMAIIIAITMGITFTMAVFSASATVTGVITFQGDFAIVVYDITDGTTAVTGETLSFTPQTLAINSDGYGFGSAKLTATSLSTYYNTTGSVTITVIVTTTQTNNEVETIALGNGTSGAGTLWTLSSATSAGATFTMSTAHTAVGYTFADMIKVNWDESKISDDSEVSFTFAIDVTANA